MFGGKSKAEKEREKELKKQEMERKIAEYKNKKNGGKTNSSKSKSDNGKQIIHNRGISNNSQSAQSKQNLNSSNSSESDNEQPIEGVVTVRRRSQGGSNISPQEFNKRASEFFKKQSQEKRYREIVARIQRNDMINISEMLSQSQDTFSFYREFMRQYNNDEMLIALDIFDKSDIELFEYVIKNDLVDELYQGDVQLYDQDYMRHERDEFFEFRKKHPQFQVEHTALDEYLPHIYLLGNERDFELVDAMSLATEIHLLSTPNDVQLFAKDDSYKVILLFKAPHREVIKDYLQVKNAQDFPIFSTFPVDNIQKDQQIIPFNRDNLVKMTALK